MILTPWKSTMHALICNNFKFRVTNSISLEIRAIYSVFQNVMGLAAENKNIVN
jgi:hypothetical protein